MPASQWLTARQRDFRGGETQALLPEEVGRNQLLRMENAMIYPTGWVTAAHQIDTPMINNLTGGFALVPRTDGTHWLYTTNLTEGEIKAVLLDTSSSSPLDVSTVAAYPCAGARIIGVFHATNFLGKWYCPNYDLSQVNSGLLNLTDTTIISVPSDPNSVVLSIHTYANRIWLLGSDGKIHISNNGDATTWNALNVILLPNSEPVIGFFPVQGGVIVHSRSSLYAMYGTTYSDITFVPLLLGKKFTDGAVEIEGVVYILSTEGVYQVTLNGAQPTPHKQHQYFKENYSVLSDRGKTITALYLQRFRAIIFTWREYYSPGGQSLVFYLDGAYLKLNRLLPTQDTLFSYALAVNDANIDYLWQKDVSTFARSTYPSVDTIVVEPTILQTRHEDCDSSRDKVWSCFTIVTGEAVYGVTIQAYLDYSDTPIAIANESACAKGENHFWLDELPRSKTLSLLITINNQAITLLVSDDDPEMVLTDDETGDALTTGVNPGNWTIKEMRLRYREAGPAL